MRLSTGAVRLFRAAVLTLWAVDQGRRTLGTGQIRCMRRCHTPLVQIYPKSKTNLPKPETQTALYQERAYPGLLGTVHDVYYCALRRALGVLCYAALTSGVCGVRAQDFLLVWSGKRDRQIALLLDEIGDVAWRIDTLAEVSPNGSLRDVRGTDIPCAGIVLRAPSAMSGTDIVYAAARASTTRSEWYQPRLWSYAMPGTDVAITCDDVWY
eukprot:3941929-Rhodomonas_salina.5